ncbi:MAG: chromate transporter [Erysipelotrichaceae bacterium]|nr:chromate transporter [Erysipelotrichaceae bacterium]
MSVRSENKVSTLWSLFSTSFLTSLTANSGYAIIASMKNIFVKKKGWITEEEMSDYIGLAQSAPGMIAANISLIIGYQMAGVMGSFLALLGIILPPLVIMIAVTAFYQVITANEYVRVFMTGMQAGVVAMLLDILIGLFKPIMKQKSAYPFVLIVLSFLYIRYANASVFFLALLLIACGVVKTFLFRKERENA